MRTLYDFFIENSVRVTLTEYSILGHGRNPADYLSAFFDDCALSTDSLGK